MRRRVSPCMIMADVPIPLIPLSSRAMPPALFTKPSNLPCDLPFKYKGKFAE